MHLHFLFNFNLLIYNLKPNSKLFNYINLLKLEDKYYNP